MKTAVMIYWSKTGNTEKVALAIKEGLERAGVKVSAKRAEEAADVDFFDYDLVCIGSPSYEWHSPKPMEDLLKMKINNYRNQSMRPEDSRQECTDFLHIFWPSHRDQRGYTSWQVHWAILGTSWFHSH
jgi:hypothetical protein